MNMGRRNGCLISVIIFLAAIAVIVIVMVNVIGKKLDSFNRMDFTVLDMNTVEDGSYIGDADGSIVKVTVEVTVKDHAITDIQILKHDNGKGKPAEAIVDTIVAKNSLEVDAISGATNSSNVIKAAVLDALTK